MAEAKSRESLQALVGSMIDEAQDFISSKLAQDRITATDYYKGRTFGTEEEGRSNVVLTEVRDTVRAILPSLMRVFTGPERYVEFRPRGQTDEPMAQQMTDYINLILLEDNDGFNVLYSAFKDALVRRTGVMKWWNETAEQRESTAYSGLTEEQLLALAQDKAVELSPPEPGPAGWSTTVTRVGQRQRIRVAAVPPEEVYWNETARDFETATIVGHTREVPLHELIAMGYDKKQLTPLAGKTGTLTDGTSEEDARRFDAGGVATEEERDEATLPVRYDEVYVELQLEEGGPVQLCKVCMAGDTHELLADPVPVSHRPFTMFCPDPEPHTLVGLSIYDDVAHVQRIKSYIMRGVLDSLELSLNPATEVVEGAVNLKDLMNPEVGRVVRVTAPGMMREVRHSFAGADGLAVMQYVDQIKENATGQSKAAAGLDADALQSSTKAAVAATLSAAQQRVEMIARVFAELGMKPLFKGLLRTVIEHQDAPRIVRLRGRYVEVDPRAWDASMDVVVNVALGGGMAEERMATLAGIAAKQEQILQTLGPVNPLVKVSQYRNTLARMVELAGFRNAAEFFQEIDPQQEQQMEQASANAPQQDPNAALAQAETAKAQINAQVQMAKLQQDGQLEQMKLQMNAQQQQQQLELETQRLAADIALRTKELELKYGTAMDRELIQASVAQEKSQIDAMTKMTTAAMSKEASDTQAGAKIATAEISARAAREAAERAEEATEGDDD